MMKKLSMICLFSALLSIGTTQMSNAQLNPLDNNGFNQQNDVASKLPFKKKLTWAEGLYKANSFYTAERYYFQLLKEQPRNPFINYRLAECLRYNRDYILAAKYFGEAYALSSSIYPKAVYEEGLMLKQSGDYEQALERLTFFRKTYMGKDRRTIFKIVDVDILGCKMAIESLSNPGRAFVKNAGPNVNTAYTDYAPYPLGDTALLFATMNQNKIVDKNKDKREDYLSRFRWSPKEFDRTRIKDSFEVALQFNDGRFNDKDYHVGNGSWSPGGDRFYYTKCREDDSMDTKCKIWVAEFDRKKGIWQKPKPMSDEINDPLASTTQPYCALIGKKEVLFFSSNKIMQSAGGYDIWYSVYDTVRKTYRRPQNCGKRVNSPLDEFTPYYDTRKGKLYFSSNGKVNVGGFDIFSADGGPTRYTNITNLGFPINSPADDMYYIQDAGKKDNAYVVSNRLGSIFVKNPTCCDDIWRVIKEPNFYVRGKVVDEYSGDVIPQVVVKMKDEAKSTMKDTFFSKTGNFLFYTPLGNNYSIAADKEGYVSGRTEINTTGKSVMDPDDTTEVTIYMQKISSSFDFHVQNVYYNFDDGKFQPASYLALDSLVNFMKDNPGVSVEIRAHTDDLGGNEYNDELSIRRAEAVRQYLATKGVEQSRMVARGFGSKNPIAMNKKAGKDNPEGRQYNRRTEFRIIGEVPGMRIIYDQNRPEYIDKSGNSKRDENLRVPVEPGDDAPAPKDPEFD